MCIKSQVNLGEEALNLKNKISKSLLVLSKKSAEAEVDTKIHLLYKYIEYDELSQSEETSQ